MTGTATGTEARAGQAVYDPRGVVEAEQLPLAPRVTTLDGLRLGVLDNTKWNAGKLLRAVVAQLGRQVALAEVTFYQKESFSKNAAEDLIARIAARSDIALVAIGD